MNWNPNFIFSQVSENAQDVTHVTITSSFMRSLLPSPLHDVGWAVQQYQTRIYLHIIANTLWRIFIAAKTFRWRFPAFDLLPVIFFDETFHRIEPINKVRVRAAIIHQYRDECGVQILSCSEFHIYCLFLLTVFLLLTLSRCPKDIKFSTLRMSVCRFRSYRVHIGLFDLLCGRHWVLSDDTNQYFILPRRRYSIVHLQNEG